MEDVSPNQFEITTESFMVKVQIEEMVEDFPSRQWRGVIVHIASGTSFHFDNLHEIESVVIPYLKAYGVEFSDHKTRGQP